MRAVRPVSGLLHLQDHAPVARRGLLALHLEVVVPADVPGLLGPLLLVRVRLRDRRLDLLPGTAVDRVGAMLTRESPAALVRREGKLVGIVSRYDVLQQLIGGR